LNSENWTAVGNEISFLALQNARNLPSTLFYSPTTTQKPAQAYLYNPDYPNGVNPPSGVIALNSAGPSKSTLSFSPSSTNFLK
jgi:hypothetical protein